MKNSLLLIILSLVYLNSSYAQKVIAISTNEIETERRVIFSGQSKSFIDWKKVDTTEYLDLQLWKKHSALTDKEPNWRRNLSERNLREMVGRVIQCSGDCRLVRGKGFNKLRFQSAILEGDDIVTYQDGYTWIFLMDGTLVRVSPNSSISFKEINIGQDEVFFQARVNYGNILWMSRQRQELLGNNSRETDTLFLPLDHYEANPISEKQTYNEDDLFSYFKDKKTTLKKYEWLNELIKKNNEMFLDKPSYAMIILPNGTIHGKQMTVETIVLTGSDSFIKRRGHVKQRMSNALNDEATFYYRGFENKKESEVPVDEWMVIDKKGRNFFSYMDYRKFSMGEYLTTNIPSILISRELLLQKYSQFVFQKLDADFLAENYGYRLWGSITKTEERDDDLAQRIRFLKEYTRRLETANIVVTDQFQKKLLERGESLENSQYSSQFYSKALGHYFSFKDEGRIVTSEGEVLNSTLKPYWKKIHGIR